MTLGSWRIKGEVVGDHDDQEDRKCRTGEDREGTQAEEDDQATHRVPSKDFLDENEDIIQFREDWQGKPFGDLGSGQQTIIQQLRMFRRLRVSGVHFPPVILRCPLCSLPQVFLFLDCLSYSGNTRPPVHLPW